MNNSRRDFMKLGAATLATALLPAAGARAADASATASTAVPASSPLAAGELRLLTFAPREQPQSARVGMLHPAGNRVIDLGAAAQRRGTKLSFDPASMLSFIAAGDRGLSEARELLTQAKPEDGPALADIRLLAPIPTPARNVYAVGWNYLEHFKEGEGLRNASTTPKDLPAHPVFFTKGSHTINEPYGTIPYDPNVSTMIDWEGELAIIIGKRGKNIPEDRALEHVLGYSVINDTTARDLQQTKHGGQWFKGKSLDGHGPLGPWIVVTAGAGPKALDFDNLALFTRVNGVVKQEANTKEMYFKVPRIVAELSVGLTLEPGDIIATGTPPGVGFARKPPEFLKPGDVMETEIVGIGVIRNVITA